MKFMKLGTRSDTFYTEQATRSLVSDIPPNLVIKINDTTYLLHKSPLLSKCGLLQRLCSDTNDSESDVLELHDMPGGSEAFELCAKFCYGISINISAYNFVPSLCASKLLQMNESIERGNFVGKLESFFGSCILEGWKDSVSTLQATEKLPEWSENLGIIRKCIDSIIEKILTPPSQVKWSYTYTRPGYNRKQHHSVPKDWWTEDISILNIDLFRCIIMTIRSTHVLPPQLIGESLHVYAYRGSVSVGFLLKLLKLVQVVLESFLKFWKRISPGDADNRHYLLRSIRKVGKLVDSYLQVVARDDNMEVSKFVALAETVPAIGRLEHDDLYQAINIYLKKASFDDRWAGGCEDWAELEVHSELSKAEKKRLCGILECQKLSPEVRAHAVKNEFLPLRTVVQLLYYEQEKDSNGTTSTKLQKPHELLLGAKMRPATRDSNGKRSLGLDKEEFKREDITRKASLAESREKSEHKTQRLDDKLALDLEKKMVIREVKEEAKKKMSIGRTRSSKSEYGNSIEPSIYENSTALASNLMTQCSKFFSRRYDNKMLGL
ncbi:BTB/POZ domain-containing protein, partial [Trifolium pratense]